MSDTKQAFTPGPWIVGGNYTIRTTKSSMDRICRTRNEHYKHDDKEDEANAYLIAAAPDMYEAGKEMAEAVALLPANDGRILGLIPILCRLRAAIAKAEGRT